MNSWPIEVMYRSTNRLEWSCNYETIWFLDFRLPSSYVFLRKINKLLQLIKRCLSFGYQTELFIIFQPESYFCFIFIIPFYCFSVSFSLYVCLFRFIPIFDFWFSIFDFSIFDFQFSIFDFWFFTSMLRLIRNGMSSKMIHLQVHSEAFQENNWSRLRSQWWLYPSFVEQWYYFPQLSNVA